MAIEDVIAQQSVAMADQMLHIAEWAHSEEEVRYECNKLIDEFLKRAGIKVRGRHEYHIGSGRLDSKYQGVLLEYKHPKGPEKIVEGRDAPGNRAVVAQLKKRFVDFEKEEHFRPERLFGVGCDADTLLFVRYQGGQWVIDEAQPVTPHSVERLLRALVSLGAQGKSFTPECLSDDFGSDSKTGQKGVRDLYWVITNTQSKKALMFFNQWKILFGEVCGYDVEGKSAKIQKLGDHYGIPDARPAELLFAVHSYYAIFMKFLAAEIAGSFSPLGVSVLKKCAAAPTSAALRREMESLEQGGIWAQLAITNFLEGDLFSWYLDAWDDRVSGAVRSIVLQLCDYDPTTLSVDPAESRDLLKKLYHELFPRSVRHDLGEYYTPDWLAEHVLNEVGYDGDPDKRILDPGCGSGTFLVMVINRIKAWFEEHRHECGYGESELVQKILKNVVGFDLNPLAVMASRTNYLMALRDLVKHAGSIEIPVYLCDSIMTPTEFASRDLQPSYLTDTGRIVGGSAKPMELRTAVGKFYVPGEIAASQEAIGKYAEVIEFCVRNKYSTKEFISRCEEEGVSVTEEALHGDVYRRMQELDAQNENGIWARIIKNAFAPLFTARVDYVVGNPPWVNWRSLPAGYRDSIAPLWQRYNLFTQTGLQARLGGGMDDLSVLMLYVAADRFLKHGGCLGFVITQTLFKSAGGGQGFRRLRIDHERFLQVKRVCDFTRTQPFEGATNRTSVVALKVSDHPMQYPASYRVFLPLVRRSDVQSMDMDVASAFLARDLEAVPVDTDPGASWITVPRGLHSVVERIRGQSPYRARIGAHSGGAAGVFWVEVLAGSGDRLIVRNLHDAGRNKFPMVERAVEADFVRPLIRGRDVDRWAVHSRHHILMPYRDANGGKALAEEELRTQYPMTYAYFHEFRNRLTERPHYRQHFAPTGQPYWSMYNVGDYTFAAHRIVWREQSAQFKCCVVPQSEGRTLVADAKLIVVECPSDDAAHLLAACLNSAPARFFIQSYAIEVQVSTHVLKHVRVPAYDGSPRHRRLANLSRRCHEAAGRCDKALLARLELELDKEAAGLWGISEEELAALRSFLDGDYAENGVTGDELEDS